MIPHHTNDVVCALCELKLADAHPSLRSWFYNVIKPEAKDAHISWSFRNESQQNDCVNEGKSQQKWPTSPHNHTLDGKPYSLALDLFQLDDTGKAQFHKDYFTRLSDLRGPISVTWGGHWASLHDYDHFQLNT